MKPLDWVLAALAERTGPPHRSGGGYAARCPAHEDSTASLSIRETSDGVVLVKCFAGCSTEAVVPTASVSGPICAAACAVLRS